MAQSYLLGLTGQTLLLTTQVETLYIANSYLDKLPRIYGILIRRI